MSRSTLVAVLIAPIFVTACAAGGDPVGAVARDSAGVIIVENTAGMWDADEAWRIAEPPALTIGAVDGPDVQQLYRVMAALRLPDGRIVVVNNGTYELRFYDPEGNHIFSSGREGDGPGEFRTLQTAWLLGDSLFAYDWRQFRVSVFATADGAFVRSFNLDRMSDGTLPYLEDLFADRTLLTRRMSGDGERTGGRDTVLLFRYSLDGQPVAPLRAFADDEQYLGRDGDRVFSIDRPFGRQGQMAVHGDRLYYGSTDTYQIEVHTSAGELERIVRLGIPNPPLTSDEIRAYEEERRERLARASPPFRELYQRVELPDTKPAHGEVLVDAIGNVWVAEYRRRREDQTTWRVFDTEGRYLGVVETPEGVRIFQIGADYLLGLWRDDLDVEQVRLFTIEKPEAEGHGL